MKKLMVAFAAIAAFVSVASAEDWFTGTIGSEAYGKWTMTPGEGEITTNSTTLVLEDAAASFVASPQKALSGSENLNFATSARFAYSYDELPAVDDGAKAGVVVFENKYYVLAKDDTANKWVPTDIGATLDSPVAVSVTISNGNNAVYAIYNIADSSITKEVVASGNWGTVDYSGSGEVASLVGTTIPLAEPGYPIPGEKTIPKSIADQWAEANGIAPADLGAVLLSGTEFNGRTAAESCLLGVATNAELTAEVADKAKDKLDFTLNCTPVSGRAIIKVTQNGTVVDSGVEVNKVSLAIDDGIYQVVAEVDGANKQIPVSQLIGVKGTEVEASKVYFIGAPWADCAIADLFKKTCCAEGDQVEIYDAESDSYKSWKFKSGAWEFASEQGDEPESIKKGQAVKYTAIAAGTLYTVGNVTEVAETDIVAGGDSGAMWNLVASPSVSIPVAQLPLDSTNARALVLGGDDGITAQKIYLKVGKVFYVKDGWNEPAAKVADGAVIEGAFFLKTKDATKVTWPDAAQE